MRTNLAAVTLTLCFGSLPAPAGAESVTVVYEATAVTVSKTPFGVEVPLDTAVHGFFTFDTSTPDDNVENVLRGEYPHESGGGFLAEFLDKEVRGSMTPYYEVVLAGIPGSDTFRAYDGPRPVGPEGGVMTLDGLANGNVELFLAITDDVFDDDALMNPFPLYDFGFLGTPHTFSLKDDRGTMLMQFDDVFEAACGDPGGGGVSAGDALVVLRASVGSRSCLACLCDVDDSGSTTAVDALKTLKFAVGSGSPLTCPACV